MKNYVITVMLGALASASAQESAPAWCYELPETGLMPSAFTYEFASSMRERHGGDSHFGMQSVNLAIPLSDPFRSTVYGWSMMAELNSTISFVDAEGTLDLESDTLYRFSLPFSLIRNTEEGGRIVLAVAPTVSSDLERAARCFDFGVYAAYTKPINDSFSCTLGIAGYPRFARHYFLPVVGFEWKPADGWTVALRNFRLSAMRSVTERFSAGLFAAAEGGVWTVETTRGLRMLNVQSFVMGLTGEYDFAREGQRKRIITASLGSTLATSVRFHEFRDDRDADESHHYRPGLYAAFGVDFRF